MTPASVTRFAIGAAVVLAVLFAIDLLFAAPWPGRSPEVLRGLAGALAALIVGALFFARRESDSAGGVLGLVAIGAGLLGTVLVLAGVGLLSSVPDDRAEYLFVHVGFSGPGLGLVAVALGSASAAWLGDDG